MNIFFKKLIDFEPKTKTCLMLFLSSIFIIILLMFLKFFFISQILTIFFLSFLVFKMVFSYGVRDDFIYTIYFLLDIGFILVAFTCYYENYLNINKTALINVCNYGRYGRFYGCSLVNEYQYKQSILFCIITLSYGMFSFVKIMIIKE